MTNGEKFELAKYLKENLRIYLKQNMIVLPPKEGGSLLVYNEITATTYLGDDIICESLIHMPLHCEWGAL